MDTAWIKRFVIKSWSNNSKKPEFASEILLDISSFLRIMSKLRIIIVNPYQS